MTVERILNDLTMNLMTTQQARLELEKGDKRKLINFYKNIWNIQQDPLNDAQLQELHSIVGVLQILYDSNVGSPVSDSDYDGLQEILVDMGIPRNTSSYEINDQKKISHIHTRLRGSLGKVYYLYPDEPRTNKSRKYLDEWLKSITAIYEKKTGKTIDFNKVAVRVQPKFDGCSVEQEWDGKPVWITRGDTKTNRASDVTRIMKIFNDVFPISEGEAIQFECMMPEGNKDKINQFYKSHPYSDSRQIVISIFNSVEPDFKVDYLYPVPLRIIRPGDEIESVHPQLIEKFPTMTCTFGDRDRIKQFANEHRFVDVNGVRLRTDGAVMTIMDPEICKILGRDRNINNYEIAYKFTEETAISKVKDIEFYVSPFGHITPVLVVNDVILKGKTVNHITLSNKERFDELALCYGDEVLVHYDIIPYVTISPDCRRSKLKRRIPFIEECPCCREKLDLDVVEVQCHNPDCPSRIIGRVLNYCSTLRIKNIGYSTIEDLHDAGLLEHGIRSLYRLRKYKTEIQDLDGFGKLKTNKMIAEIESKRRLKDYEFFGAYGIEDMGTKTFEMIFKHIPLHEFLDMIKVKNFDLFTARLIQVPGVGTKKAEYLIQYLRVKEHQKELQKILDEVRLEESYGKIEAPNGRIVFSDCRASDDDAAWLLQNGFHASDTWSSSARCLVVPNDSTNTGKVEKAQTKGVPIVRLNGRSLQDALREAGII